MTSSRYICITGVAKMLLRRVHQTYTVNPPYLAVLDYNPYLHDALSIARLLIWFFFFQAEDGIRDLTVTGVQTCALPIFAPRSARGRRAPLVSRAPGCSPKKPRPRIRRSRHATAPRRGTPRDPGSRGGEIGRASCRERV